MNIRQLICVNMEIKIFKLLKQRHLEEKHSNPFIYLCVHCNKECEIIMNEYIEVEESADREYMELQNKSTLVV